MGASAVQHLREILKDRARRRYLPSTERGLDPEGRYHVRKISDPTGRHEQCRYFVLDPQHDPLARDALSAYATAARAAGYGSLADDLDAWLSAAEEEKARG